MADDQTEEPTLTDAELADVLERAVKALRVGDEGRGTSAWYSMTGAALKEARDALDSVLGTEKSDG